MAVRLSLTHSSDLVLPGAVLRVDSRAPRASALPPSGVANACCAEHELHVAGIREETGFTTTALHDAAGLSKSQPGLGRPGSRQAHSRAVAMVRAVGSSLLLAAAVLVIPLLTTTAADAATTSTVGMAARPASQPLDPNCITSTSDTRTSSKAISVYVISDPCGRPVRAFVKCSTDGTTYTVYGSSVYAGGTSKANCGGLYTTLSSAGGHQVYAYGVWATYYDWGP